jgi:DNA gyrase subunit A
MGVQLINLGKRDAVVGIARNAEAGAEADEVDADEEVEAVEGTEGVAQAPSQSSGDVAETEE